jgi:hypothetical protein
MPTTLDTYLLKRLIDTYTQLNTVAGTVKLVYKENWQ